MMIDLGVFIGRFQPFHKGHLHSIQAMLEECRYVCILLGSADNKRGLRNPFTAQEREAMIRGALDENVQKRVFFQGIVDTPDDQTWVDEVKKAVDRVVDTHHLKIERIALFGHDKDDSSFYLSLFPNWQRRAQENYCGMNATPYRNAYLENLPLDEVNHDKGLPSNVIDFLTYFRSQVAFQELRKKYEQQGENNG